MPSRERYVPRHGERPVFEYATAATGGSPASTGAGGAGGAVTGQAYSVDGGFTMM